MHKTYNNLKKQQVVLTELAEFINKNRGFRVQLVVLELSLLSLKTKFLKLPQMMDMTLPRGLRLTFCMVFLMLAYASDLYAQSSEQSQTVLPIKIPWGFQWGESEAEVEQALQGTKTTIVQRKKIGERDVLIVSGFIQRLLQQALFYFQSDSLNEIELQYGDKNWTAEQYTNFFNQTRSNIENKYGPGHIITEQKNQENQGVLQTIIGYQWTQVSATLQLFLFTAEKGSEAFRVVSLHYRGF